MQPDIDDYLSLFRLYEQPLTVPAEPRGERLRFPFERVVRLLSLPSEFNRSLPSPFLEVAERYTHGDSATAAHFRYDENRQFFLSDLRDYVQLQAAKRRLRG